MQSLATEPRNADIPCPGQAPLTAVTPVMVLT